MTNRLILLASTFIFSTSCTPLTSSTLLNQNSAEAQEKVVIAKPISESLLNSFVALTEQDLSNALAKKYQVEELTTFLIPRIGTLFSADCTTSSESITSETSKEGFLQFSCAHLSGSVETLNADLNSSVLHQYSAQLESKNNDSIKKISLKKSVAEEPDGSVLIEKDLSEIVDFGTETSSISGSISLSYFGASDIEPNAESDLEMNGSLSTQFDGSASETLIISTEDLHYKACGISSGLIRLSSSNRKVEIRWSECGKWQISELEK